MLVYMLVQELERAKEQVYGLSAMLQRVQRDTSYDKDTVQRLKEGECE